MKSRFLIALTFLSLSASIVFGQQPHTRPTPAQMIAKRVSRLTTLLTLTSAQQAQATTIFTTEQTAVSGVAAAMKTARTALTTAVEANDTAAISTQAGQIGSLTTQSVTARSTANAAFYAILTADQQAKYKQLMAHGRMAAGSRFRR